MFCQELFKIATVPPNERMYYIPESYINQLRSGIQPSIILSEIDPNKKLQTLKNAVILGLGIGGITGASIPGISTAIKEFGTSLVKEEVQNIKNSLKFWKNFIKNQTGLSMPTTWQKMKKVLISGGKGFVVGAPIGATVSALGSLILLNSLSERK